MSSPITCVSCKFEFDEFGNAVNWQEFYIDTTDGDMMEPPSSANFILCKGCQNEILAAPERVFADAHAWRLAQDYHPNPQPRLTRQQAIELCAAQGCSQCRQVVTTADPSKSVYPTLADDEY